MDGAQHSGATLHGLLALRRLLGEAVLVLDGHLSYSLIERFIRQQPVHQNIRCQA